MIKYQTSKWTTGITPVEVEKETASTVFIRITPSRIRRERAKTQFHHYWDTWDDAYDYLLKRSEDEVKYASERLAVAEIQLKFVRDELPTKKP